MEMEAVGGGLYPLHTVVIIDKRWRSAETVFAFLVQNRPVRVIDNNDRGHGSTGNFVFTPPLRSRYR